MHSLCSLLARYDRVADDAAEEWRLRLLIAEEGNFTAGCEYWNVTVTSQIEERPAKDGFVVWVWPNAGRTSWSFWLFFAWAYVSLGRLFNLHVRL